MLFLMPLVAWMARRQQFRKYESAFNAYIHNLLHKMNSDNIEIRLMQSLRTSGRRDKANYEYYCACNEELMRYKTYQSLHTHIKIKHHNAESFVKHLKNINAEINAEKKKKAKKVKKIVRSYINVNKQDLRKQSMVDKAVKDISSKYPHLLLVIAESNEEDYFQFDNRGERNMNDEKVVVQENTLIEEYKLGQLFEDSFPEFPEFQHYGTPFQSQEPGKIIFMKKELAQFFSMKWAPKIHLQLDIFAALQREIEMRPDLLQRIKQCQAQMWKELAQVPLILKEYYKALLNDYCKWCESY